MSFTCPVPCDRTFDSKKALTLHQRACNIDLADDETFSGAADKFRAKQERRKKRRLGTDIPTDPVEVIPPPEAFHEEIGVRLPFF